MPVDCEINYCYNISISEYHIVNDLQELATQSLNRLKELIRVNQYKGNKRAAYRTLS